MTAPSLQRRQFTLRQLMFLFVLVSVALTLGLQLRAFGWVLALYLTGLTFGVWRRDSRWWLASGSAMLVFFATYIACWFQAGDASIVEEKNHHFSFHFMKRLDEGLQQYAKSHGDYPDSLQSLPDSIGSIPTNSAGEVVDTWGRPLEYRKLPNGFELRALGRDGRRGGVGLDGDLIWGDPPSTPHSELPWSQFFLETSATDAVLFPALMASLMTGSMWFTGHRTTYVPGESKISRAYLVLLLCTTVGAIVMATFLALFYIIASQSSH